MPEPTRRHLQGLLFLRLLLFSFLVGAMTLLTSFGLRSIWPPPLYPLAFMGLVGVATLGSVAVLATRPAMRTRRFTMTQVLLDLSFVWLLALGTGASRSIFLPLFVLPVLVAGILLGGRCGYFGAAMATLFLGALLVLEQKGWLPAFYRSFSDLLHPPTTKIGAANLFAVYGALSFLVAALANTLGRRLQATEQVLRRMPNMEYASDGPLLVPSRLVQIGQTSCVLAQRPSHCVM